MLSIAFNYSKSKSCIEIKGYIFDMRGKRELMHVKMLNVVVLLKKYSRTCLFSKSVTTKPF